MLHFGMNMPFILMTIYGSMMILIVLLFRALLKKRLPKFVFPVLWCVVLVRLLIPFSVSSPLTVKTSAAALLSALPKLLDNSTYKTVIVEDTETAWQGSAIENMSIRTKPTPLTAVESAESAVTVTNDTISSGAADIMANAVGVSEDPVITYAYTNGHSFALGRHALLLLYAVGFVLTAVVLSFQRYRYAKKLGDSLLLEHNETVNTLLREMDMGHILVFTNDRIASPLACGLFAPRIYLPTRMDFANRELMRHILLHETMHIRRRDNLLKAVMLVALILHWFNPLVWIMSVCFAADLETACDKAVLKTCADEVERKDYAFHLLAMAITGSRATLLYSAFSRTEVEKRIRNILNYRKASVFLLLAAVCFITCSTAAFATCAQAPFSPYLTSSCASDLSRWGAKVYTTRDLSLGSDAQKRAEDIVFAVLRTDTDSDPLRMDGQMRTALSNEFHVEKSAFRIDFFLCLNDDELIQEYIEWELTRNQEGLYQYKGEPVRLLIDEAGGVFYSQAEKGVDVTVIRDRFGYISDLRVEQVKSAELERKDQP